MTHELKNIINAYIASIPSGQKFVLATVVHLEGSSYRRPGVRMLISEDGTMIGAVSGGCVEKEVLRQAQSVFSNGTGKIMTYDGRYRLGCEGILYILIEPFAPDKAFIKAFHNSLTNRSFIEVTSYFDKEEKESTAFGSVFHFEGKEYSLQSDFKQQADVAVFKQKMPPCHQLIIIGAEHDAVQLSTYASLSGWEVTIVASPLEEKEITHFTGAQELLTVTPDEFNTDIIDPHTAVVLMTHSFVKDLQFLFALQHTEPVYLGVLGPARRREKLLDEFISQHPEVSDVFIDRIYGPAGLHIGAETPQEIAISVLAEILSVIRAVEPMKLKDKKGSIHN